MTFDEWWNAITRQEQLSMDREGAESAWQFGQLEAAEHILQMWHQPWGVTQKSFTHNLEEYVEELSSCK